MMYTAYSNSVLLPSRAVQGMLRLEASKKVQVKKAKKSGIELATCVLTLLSLEKSREFSSTTLATSSS